MIWVEVLDRRGHVTARVRCATLPATLGRAWTNDVVLDDRHVDAVHARLVRDEQGALALEDAGSLNGIVTAAGARAARVSVAGPTTVHLGQTAVRLVPADAPVGPAVPLPPATRGLLALVTAPRAALLLVLVGVAAAGVAFWLGDPEAEAPRKAAGGALALAVVVGIWAGVWALVGRATVQRAMFHAHFAAAWLTLLVLELVGVAAGYAGFILDVDGLATLVDAVAAFACCSTLLAAHFALATSMTARRRAAVAIAVVAAIAGAVGLLGEAAKGEFEGSDVTIRASVRPVPGSMVRTREVDAFLGETATLQREVDRLAAEP